MKIVFMGTPEFAVPTLKALHHSSHSIMAVITQADKPKGRGQKLSVSPVKQYALESNLPILQPKTVNEPEFIESLKKNRPDIVIVVAFGQILSENFLKIPRIGIGNNDIDDYLYSKLIGFDSLINNLLFR